LPGYPENPLNPETLPNVNAVEPINYIYHLERDRTRTCKLVYIITVNTTQYW